MGGELMKKFGNWEIVKSLEEGGQAHIFLAKNMEGKKVVVKRLKNIKRIGRFKKEIEILSSLESESFPKILEINTDDEKPYFVMDYYPDGCVTKKHIAKWPVNTKVWFFLELVNVIRLAHENGIIHRDLKPENILLKDGITPVVSDFGLSYIDEETGERQTMTEEVVGSRNYLSPELEDGRSDAIGVHNDIYSLGKIAYWLFSDGKIYSREKHREREFNLANQIHEHWIHLFNDFLDKATANQYQLRYSDCGELLTEFEKINQSILKDTRYLNFTIEQPCVFCKRGHYKIEVNALDPDKHHGFDNFGLGRRIGMSAWLIMVCDTCGNIQAFRKDKAENWAWGEELIKGFND